MPSRRKEIEHAGSRARSPTGSELKAARGRRLRDVVGPDLIVLFCGINPGLYSAATGRHFARPGNRFWPALHAAGITPRQLRPDEQHELLAIGVGITNIVSRTTASAVELTPPELRAGATQLQRKVMRLRPKVLALVGLGAYRTAFSRPKAGIGLQHEAIGTTAVWLLPNTSGLNAHYQPKQLAVHFRELWHYASALE